jgi:hypothetical protein
VKSEYREAVGKFLETEAAAALTPSEKKIARLIAAEKFFPVIAAELGTSYAKVRRVYRMINKAIRVASRSTEEKEKYQCRIELLKELAPAQVQLSDYFDRQTVTALKAEQIVTAEDLLKEKTSNPELHIPKIGTTRRKEILDFIALLPALGEQKLGRKPAIIVEPGDCLVISDAKYACIYTPTRDNKPPIIKMEVKMNSRLNDASDLGLIVAAIYKLEIDPIKDDSVIVGVRFK